MTSPQVKLDRLQIQWDRLNFHTRDMLIRNRADTDLHAKYELMLAGLKHNRVIKGEIVLGLMHAPGSKDRHHAREGGLIAHLFEMWDAWNLMRPAFAEFVGSHPMSDTLAWRAILHHDLNKVWRYKRVTEDKNGLAIDEWKVDYTDGNEDPLGHLLPSAEKSLGILNRYGIALSPLLHNALITSEGGYSQGPRPKTETVFAKIMYLCDEFSANVMDRLNTGRFWDSKIGGLTADAATDI